MPHDTTVRRGPAWAIACARLRMPLLAIGLLLLVVDLVAGLLLDVPTGSLGLVAIALVVVGFALYLRVGTVRAEPVELRSPVRGRWVAVNSPADKVPSHGLHAYGQTYAVDVVHVPDGAWAPATTWGAPHTRPADTYPGFGAPVLSPADGVVVKVRGDRRDHAARTSVPGVLLMIAEGALLELTGRILGNHVVVQIAPDTYVLLAHLRRGSPVVAVGDRVRAGDVVAQCGNSGNTSEPHVHLQVMDRPSVLIAAGLPFRFSDVRADDGTPLAIPGGQQPFVAGDH